MNTDIVSIGSIIFDEMLEEPTTPLINGTGTTVPETALPLNSRFGIVDLWKIRSAKRHFIFYR